MKFVCAKSILCEAVNAVSPAVASKSSIMALECIYLSCTDGELTVTGYNLELGIKKTIPVTQSENGTVILNAKLFGEIINKMPNGLLHFSADEKLLTVIQGGGAKFTILGMSPDEYPDTPKVEDGESLSVLLLTLRSMITGALFAVSQDVASSPILTGVLFEASENLLTLVGVDGRRLALRKEVIQNDRQFSFVVPGKTLSEFLKLTARFAGEEEEPAVRISAGKKQIIFECMGYQMISRLLEGSFIDYKAAIPKECQTRVILSPKEFSESINRASIIISDKIKNPVKTVFENNEAFLSCETSMGKVSDNISVEMTGPKIRIGYNNKFMTDALKACEQDKVLIEMNSSISPVKLLPLEGDSFIYLVMPMRLKDDD